MRRLKVIISLIWQVPLSILSFFFYRMVRTSLRISAKREIKKRRKSNNSRQWQGLSEIVKQPQALPYLMVTGPRWNCHAVLGIVGPFFVNSSISVRVDTARKSAKRWTIVIYRGYQTETYIDSTTISKEQIWHKVNLKAGKYRLCLRYYCTFDEVIFPEIKIDNLDGVPARTMVNEKKNYESFLQQIQNFQGLFYYSLHYYVFHLLCWKRWFPDSFVKREYLPVGNPATKFYYGSLRKGEGLQIHFGQDMANNADIYITFYNRCSFPIFWENISQPEYQSDPVSSDGYYLLRINSKSKGEFDTLNDKFH